MQFQDTFETIFGTMAIFAASIAVVLAIVALVLIEACWIIKLWGELSRRWKGSLHQIGQDGLE
jgi:hypothetical protein